MISAMRSSWPAPLRDKPAILIAALSGRALAEAARASGYIPLVADFFGDADTRALAGECAVVPGDFSAGFQIDVLLPALQALTRSREVVGLVCGAGFEDRPELLNALAQHWPLLGNGADVVARVKDPMQLAALCAKADVPHPLTRREAPASTDGWLRKLQGGSGGGHIAMADESPAGNVYYQRHAPGIPVSLLLLADGVRAVILGCSRQWADPATGRPFRYGGALRPAGISGTLLSQLGAAASRLVALLGTGGNGLGSNGLRGLNSFDFLVDADSFTLLEINPRPGATLDIFTHPKLMRAHIAAVGGVLPGKSLSFSGSQAAATVYCDRDMDIHSTKSWPKSIKDRPNRSTGLQIGQPVCTVVARAAEPQAARRILDQRIKFIRARLARDQQG